MHIKGFILISFDRRTLITNLPRQACNKINLCYVLSKTIKRIPSDVDVITISGLIAAITGLVCNCNYKADLVKGQVIFWLYSL